MEVLSHNGSCFLHDLSNIEDGSQKLEIKLVVLFPGLYTDRVRLFKKRNSARKCENIDSLLLSRIWTIPRSYVSFQ